MSDSRQKPTVTEICKLAFEANGFDFYCMNDQFNQINNRFRFMIVWFNCKTNKTHTLSFNNKRVMINYAYQKGYTSYNPCEINKKTYCFKKNMIYRVSYVGNRTSNAPELKYISNAQE